MPLTIGKWKVDFPISVQPRPFDTDWINITGMATASVYTALDAIGDSFEVSGLPRAGEIRTVLVQDEDKEEISAVLHMFDAALVTPTADHDPFDVKTADMQKQIGEIPVTNADYSTSAGSSLATVQNLGFRFTAPRGILYSQWKTLGTPNIAASKRLQVRFLGISTDGK